MPMSDVIITSWVDKYRVNRYQKSTIVLLNDLSLLKELRSIHKNTFDLKRRSSGFPQSIFG